MDSVSTFVSASVSSAPALLGEVIAWDTPSTVAYTAVLDALRTAGLSTDAAPDLSPRSAFSRAAKGLKENRQIDKVVTVGREMKFQLTHRMEADGELSFVRETFVFLDLDCGAIRSDDYEIGRQARELFSAAMGVRTASDVTKIVQGYFRANGDLFPLNSKGVAYFVPQRFSAFIAQVETFLTTVGGKLSRFPVPTGTPTGNQSVRDAVDNGLASMTADLMHAVDEWDDTTRESTMESATARWRELSYKTDAYAEYLGGAQESLRAALVDAKAKLAAKIVAVGEAKEAAKSAPAVA